MINNDFNKFAIASGVSSTGLHKYGNMMNTKCSYINPTILEERELNVAGYDVFSRLLVDRIIFLGTEINDDVANIISSQLLYLDSVDSESDIKLFINSPGGSISSGFQILDTMNWVGPKVCTYNMGLSASMASILLSSGEKGFRYSLPHGEVMLHQPLGGTGYAQASDIEIMNNHIQMYKDELYRILSENTGKDVDTIRHDCDRDNWFSAQRALEYGLIDEIIDKKK